MLYLQKTRTSSTRLQRKEIKWQEARHQPQSQQQQQFIQTTKHQEDSCSPSRTIKGGKRRIACITTRRNKGGRRQEFLKRRAALMSVSPTLLSISSLLYTQEDHNAMYLPIKISSDNGEGIELLKGSWTVEPVENSLTKTMPETSTQKRKTLKNQFKSTMLMGP